jgi:hypothetical protein
VDMACQHASQKSECIANQSRDAVQRALLTLFSLLLRLVRLTVSYSFMMSNSTLEMNTVTVRPSR